MSIPVLPTTSDWMEATAMFFLSCVTRSAEARKNEQGTHQTWHKVAQKYIYVSYAGDKGHHYAS